MHLNTSLKFSMLFPHLTLLSFYTDLLTPYKDTFSLTPPTRLAFVILLVQTGKLKMRILPHSLNCGGQKVSKWTQLSCHTCCLWIPVARFRCQVLALPSQGFGLSQHILRQLAVKTMDMETEREILVPEIY